MRHPFRNGKRGLRQQAAAERQEAYDALSQDERIARAAKAPGFSRKQLLRLGVDLNTDTGRSKIKELT